MFGSVASSQTGARPPRERKSLCVRVAGVNKKIGQRGQDSGECKGTCTSTPNAIKKGVP